MIVRGEREEERARECERGTKNEEGLTNGMNAIVTQKHAPTQ